MPVIAGEWGMIEAEGVISMSIKTVGILTGGGDCPGLNAVIRGAVRKGMAAHNYRFRGVMQGWKGMMESNSSPKMERNRLEYGL